MIRRLFSCLLFVVACVFVLEAEALSFTSINDKNGLIDNYVEYVFEDRDGFQWFGTHSGLMRYDGQRFRLVTLPNEQRDVTLSFARQYITYITEDDSSNLWIGALTGLYKYSLKTQKFDFFEHKTGDTSSLSSNYVGKLLCDNQSRLWVATLEGLNCIDLRTNTLSQYMHDSSDSLSIISNHILTMLLDASGNLWLGTKGGLDMMDATSGRFVHYYRSGKGIDALNVRSIIFDTDSTLWAVAPYEGLFYKRRGAESFTHQPLRYNGKDISAPFSALLDDGAGNIWIGTNGDGLYIFNKKTENVTSYQDDSAPPYNICGNSISRLSQDRQGNIWIPTLGGGVSVYKPFESSHKHYSKNFQQGSLAYNILSCFAQDSHGTIWMGTDGGGFSKMIPSSFLNYDKRNGLSSNAVLAIKAVEHDLLAVATWNGGLNIFNTRTERFEQYSFESSRADGNVQDIYDLYFDKKTKMLWCCTYYDGIQVFDVAARKFVPEQVLAEQYCNWNTAKFCNKLMFTASGELWINEGRQLRKVTKKTDVACRDLTDFYSEIPFPTDMAQLRDGSIWATNQQGVYRYHQQQDTFLLIQADGCDFTDAKSLLQDSTGNVWIATGKSLLRYFLSEDRFQNISEYWSIPALQYYPKSSYRDASGNLYFGSLSGVLVLHEDSLYSTVILPELFVTRVMLHSDGNQPEHSGNNYIDATFLDSLVLNYDQSFITIEYAASNYIDNGKTQIRYILQGFDKDWSAGSADRKVIYTNIPPGEYIFRLVCTDSQGKWGTKIKSMVIIILPPWWATWWFFSLEIIFGFSLILFIIIRREKTIKKQNKYLETEVALKTSELTEKNAELTGRKLTIENSYEKLREKQLVIEIKNTQLQDALNTKDKLLTVIAHDFKNPLSTLQGFSQLLRSKIYASSLDELKPSIDKISSSAESLMLQMVEVLDWSISSEHAVQYLPADTNIEVLLSDVLLLTSETAQQKNIEVRITNDCLCSAFVDPRQISTVLRNLVINSLKFTPVQGWIEISIAEQDSMITVTVSDSGQGMSGEQIDAIMSSKKLLSADYRSGFGLQICKTFIARNKGTLSITSQIGEGSHFVVSLPKGRHVVNDTQDSVRATKLFHHRADTEATDKTMLIIDDEPDVVAYLREVFAPIYTVYVAYNGLDGADLAQNYIPDIILSDINMPHVDGKQLCLQMKQNPFTSHIPIILISGQALTHNQIDGYLHGADDYIAKPFDTELLKYKVAAMLTGRELLKERYAQNTAEHTGTTLPQSIEDKIIADIHVIIMDNLTNASFSVESLAESACMSRSQLYRKTKAVLGQTPIEYINNLKYAKAMEMIRTGRYRVSEIAYELGFSDVRHFSSSFSKKFGGPPSSFTPKSDTDK